MKKIVLILILLFPAFSSAKARQVALKWDKVTTYSNGTPIQEPVVYQVFRSMANQSNYKLIAEVQDINYSDVGVNPNKNYFYIVKCKVVSTQAVSSNSNTFRIRT